MLVRRAVLGGGLLAIGSSPSVGWAAGDSLEPAEGDPDFDSEVAPLGYAPKLIEKQVWSSPKFIGGPRRADRLVEEFLKAATGELGVSEGRNPEQVARYLELFRGTPPWPYRDAGRKRLQKFCAAGLAWAACRAYYESDDDPVTPWQDHPLEHFRDVVPVVNRLFFRLDPATALMMAGAQHPKSSQPKLRYLPQNSVGTNVKPGWPVLFHWRKKKPNGEYYRDPFPNHVGIVERVEKNILKTIEFNTSPDEKTGSQGDGGTVARKDRAFGSVLGYVAWY